MKSTLLYVGISTAVAAIAGLGLCIPNLMWLKHSTLRISNQGETPLKLAHVQVGEEKLEFKSIEPGQTNFSLLPASTQGSLAVSVPPAHQLNSFCHSYVEAKMYHIDIVVQDGQVVGCHSSLPILSDLWVRKALF